MSSWPAPGGTGWRRRRGRRCATGRGSLQRRIVHLDGVGLARVCGCLLGGNDGPAVIVAAAGGSQYCRRRRGHHPTPGCPRIVMDLTFGGPGRGNITRSSDIPRPCDVSGALVRPTSRPSTCASRSPTHLDPPRGRARSPLDRATSGRRSPSSSLAGSGCSGCSSRSPSSRSTSPRDSRVPRSRLRGQSRGAAATTWTGASGRPIDGAGRSAPTVGPRPGGRRGRAHRGRARDRQDPVPRRGARRSRRDFARSAPTPTSSGAPAWATGRALGCRMASRDPLCAEIARLIDEGRPSSGSSNALPSFSNVWPSRDRCSSRSTTSNGPTPDREVPALRDPTPHRRAGHLRAGVPADPRGHRPRAPGDVAREGAAGDARPAGRRRGGGPPGGRSGPRPERGSGRWSPARPGARST